MPPVTNAQSNSIGHSANCTPVVELTDPLIQSRLGAYSGLFYALRAKHPPTAAHGLRVAIGCSKWASWRKTDSREHSLLEVAALLHDVGKIGIPDRVLQKPAQLDCQEQLMMEMQLSTATEMLRGAGASEELINIIRLARSGYVRPSETPRESASMLAVVDAYDSMITEQVFRKALSRERAIDELFEHSGSQFDAQLVRDFAEMLSQPRPELESAVAKRWLVRFAPNPTPGFGESDSAISCGAVQNLVDTVFHRRLLDSLTDAAVYLDQDGQVLHWNRAAENLTGRQAAPLTHRSWTPQIMGLRTESGEDLTAENCPLQATRRANTQFSSRLQVRHVDGRVFIVNFTGIPVFAGKGELSGVILLVRDASAQANLEQRVQSLHVIASQDNLTKVANRAEMDRQLPVFLDAHVSTGQPGSLIICDIDHFKRINDTHGHQAGDEALVTFANVLRECSREGDLVARYGGEEFVLLCAGCDNPAATARAEEIRKAVERTPVPALNGNTMTASFGVTEHQPGDTPSTFVARADRALLTAKSTGRNRVVQLGSGQTPDGDTVQARELCVQQKASWLNWFTSRQEVPILETERLASVPHTLAIQKLEGFISDHKAEVLKTEKFQVTLRIDGQKFEASRRKGERSAVMIMDITLKPVDYRNPRSNAYQSKTKLLVSIRAANARDRRATALIGQANQLLASFNSYLVTQVITEDMRSAIAEHR